MSSLDKLLSSKKSLKKIWKSVKPAKAKKKGPGRSHIR